MVIQNTIGLVSVSSFLFLLFPTDRAVCCPSLSSPIVDEGPVTGGVVLSEKSCNGGVNQ